MVVETIHHKIANSVEYIHSVHQQAREELNLRPIDVISTRSCSGEEFIERYLRPGIPCIFDDFGSDWTAYKKWTREYFVDEMGDIPVYFHHQSENGGDIEWRDEDTQIQLSEFIARLDQGEKIKHFGLAHPLYDFVTSRPELMQDISFETFKEYLPEGRFLGLDRLDSSFWPLIPPYPPQMYIAGSNNRSPGHYDPDTSHTFHWLVWGKKQVTLFPYDSKLARKMWSLSAEDLSKPLDPEKIKHFPEFNSLQGWSAVLYPGQTIFLPSRIWHFFKYIETSMSFVVRGRSFTSLESYYDFATDVQRPTKMIPFYAELWRRVEPCERSFFGNALASSEFFVMKLTEALLKTLGLYVSAKRYIRSMLTRG